MLDGDEPANPQCRARSKPGPFADCFPAAAHDATLLTGRPELLGRDVACRARDLRLS